MASPYYFDFLAAVWEQLPTEDKERFGELWQGYEQVVASIYQTYMENHLNIAVGDLQPWTTERWLPYQFTSSSFQERAATIISSQDLSVGINLQVKKFLKIRIDGIQTFEVNVQGAIPQVTRVEEIVEKINIYAGFKFAKLIFENTIIQLTSGTVGVNSSIEILATTAPEINACEFVLGVDPQYLPAIYPKFRFPYALSYPRVASIPEFRDHIRDESVTTTLIEGTDFTIESGNIVSFSQVPPEMLWAERTQVNDETPWANFGFLTEIYQENSPRYLNIIQGLWYAVWNGPKPINIRRSLYLLFGLPTAPFPGTITRITATVFDPLTSLPITLGNVDVTSAAGVVSTSNIPVGLEADVVLGQSVETFDPLVTGIYVWDKINKPGFITEEIGRDGIQRFLLDEATRGYGDTDETKALRMLEEYTFLPQIVVDAFIYPDINLHNVRLFLDAFRPLNKTYLFQVIVGAFRDLLGLTDRLCLHVDIDVTSTLDQNETTFLEQASLDCYESQELFPVDLVNQLLLFRPAVIGDTTVTADNCPLNLDPHGILLGERVQLDVSNAYDDGIISGLPNPKLSFTNPVFLGIGAPPVYLGYTLEFKTGSLIESLDNTEVGSLELI